MKVVNLIPSDAALEPRLVGEITADFFVPAYQRGYRWGRAEVTALLDDIWLNVKQSYYLQPVVVKKMGDEWELVDGQQRLTTLYLIFEYMRSQGLQRDGANYTLRYESRLNSAAFLANPDPDRREDNIDFFHISEALDCISTWFEAHGKGRQQHVANKIHGALFENVKVIWYEAPTDLDGATLFRRLNVGRIPLTDAELVKALLLSRAAQQVPGPADRTAEIAAQWDAFERDLRQPELWAFITGEAQESPTHISLLLDTLAGGERGTGRPLFFTFETLRPQIENGPAGPLRFWNKVVDLHSLVMGWFEDRDLFHKIGFLVADGMQFADLLELSQGKLKSAYAAELRALIAGRLKLSETELRELTYQDRERASRALLLMNVEVVRRRQHSSERYSFRQHAAGDWSLEHIHAQNAEGLNRAWQWQEWLSLQSAVLARRGEVDEDGKRDLLDDVARVLASPPVTQSDFRRLEPRLIALLSSGSDAQYADVDAIANLALLHCGDNSALSNSVFAAKRDAIIELDREGHFIPVCTRNAFLKYYTGSDENQVFFWSIADRRNYLDAMVQELADYLRPEGATT